MKYLISVLFSSILFLCLAVAVYAHDLEVQCNDIKCALSSHDPLFSSSAQWKPEQVLEKKVLIKNIDTTNKDVFLKVLSKGSSRELDPYMHIDLRLEGNSDLWSGTLEELIDTETISIAQIQKNDEVVLLMIAQMDTSTPNVLQGSSSEFDFGFGFEDEQESNQGQENNLPMNSNENASTNSSSNTAIGGLIQTLQTTGEAILGNFTNAFELDTNELTPNKEVLGISDSSDNSSTIFSTSTRDTCTNPTFWWVILIVESLLLLSVQFLKGVKKKLISRSIILSGSLFALLFVLCSKWVAIFGIAPLAVIPLWIFINSNRFRSNR